ncbi:MAG: FAD-binding protein [Planctomycetaceae bacterium]|jgi:succinate dehydrogenase/fumarate reductase flavoprotein subunit|nr:FAD-binding protein [Planctomycetaceae bacterium]
MKVTFELRRTHTLVVGSGAAGLCAAVRLRAEGIDDVRIVTEGLNAGTSINTGSDKQTYYKLSLCGDEPDSPVEMAKTYCSAGGMHGDLALVEAAVSARAFLHLVNLGVSFPTDAFGQFAGYKTDHDPRRRATSIGPYTSREMCRALIRRVKELNIPTDEEEFAVELLTVPNEHATPKQPKRAVGIITLNTSGRWTIYLAENIVFAVGGPGGLYKTSVYPTGHTGAIGLALREEAAAANLTESQFGLASVKHRWNVSGTYMQVIPRVVSTDNDGRNPREFLRDAFGNDASEIGKMDSLLFLKGYQWPFDSRKLQEGSSFIDFLVYRETMEHRRVFLDYKQNPTGFDAAALSEEAKTYLAKSGMTNLNATTPIERLEKMNPAAIQMYREHEIDLYREMLEIAFCAQHNNGGLAGTHWWESINIAHLFPVGEVNGSHGTARPGGSALNAGQVGAFRAAELIQHRYAETTLDVDYALQVAQDRLVQLQTWCETAKTSKTHWRKERENLQYRMSQMGGAMRAMNTLDTALQVTTEDYERLLKDGVAYDGEHDKHEALRNRHLTFAAMTYLNAVSFAVKSGVGSRGSSVVFAPDGNVISENASFRDKILMTQYDSATQSITNHWQSCRPIPESDLWFETVWTTYREGKIY